MRFDSRSGSLLWHGDYCDDSHRWPPGHGFSWCKLSGDNLMVGRPNRNDRDYFHWKENLDINEVM